MPSSWLRFTLGSHATDLKLRRDVYVLGAPAGGGADGPNWHEFTIAEIDQLGTLCLGRTDALGRVVLGEYPFVALAVDYVPQAKGETAPAATAGS